MYVPDAIFLPHMMGVVKYRFSFSFNQIGFYIIILGLKKIINSIIIIGK